MSRKMYLTGSRSDSALTRVRFPLRSTHESVV